MGVATNCYSFWEQNFVRLDSSLGGSMRKTEHY